MPNYAYVYVVHAWLPIGENLLRGARGGMTAEAAADYAKDIRKIHRRWLDRLMREARKWIGPTQYQIIKPKTHLPKGDAQQAIPQIAQAIQADLIVMGTVARTGISGLIMGNTAENILGQIHCSVLAVKPESFVTPVTSNSP